MSSESEKPVEMPYNANPDLKKMREDIADRNYGLMIKSTLITVAGIALGAVAGAFALPVVMGGAISGMVLLAGAGIGGFAGAMGGSALSEVLTLKDKKKLAIDEEMVDSYMSGKNYWGAGYRQEVAEYGYGGPQVPASRNNIQPRSDAPPRGGMGR